MKMMRQLLPLRAQIACGLLKNRFRSDRSWNDDELVRYSGWLANTQWWSRDQIERFQRDRLQALTKHAYQHVPYYTRTFDQRGLKPEDITGAEDLRKLPLLTEFDVRNNLHDLLARNIDRSSLRFATTSGTTRPPLGVYQDKDTAWLHELAFHYRQWNWAGYTFGDRFVTLRASLQPNAREMRSWWSYNSDRNQLTLSPFHMTERYLSRYVEKLRDFRPQFIQAYPSSIEVLARYMKCHEVRIFPVTAIFCASETLYPQQRKLIEDQFQCRVFTHYGMTEKAAMAFDCEEHEGYHVGMEYGILELVDQHDQPVTCPGLRGRVVGTGFETLGMPLIRYVTEDIAEYAPGVCRCGRQSVVIKDFEGRLRDLVFSSAGRVISFTSIYASMCGTISSKIRELRFLQERKGELVVQIAKLSSYSEDEVEKEVLDALYTSLGKKEFGVKVVFVHNVPRNERGKLRLLEQRLPVNVESLENLHGS